jgi:hypothetical protein
MKAILEFELPEDKFEFNTATKGSQYLSALWDIQKGLRDATKYKQLEGHHSEITGDQADILDKVQNLFYSVLESRGIDLDIDE